MSTIIQRTVGLFETQASFAAAISTKEKPVSAKMVWAWIKRKRIPADYCPAIERATSGNVRCEDLRPDVDWAFIRRSEKTAVSK